MQRFKTTAIIGFGPDTVLSLSPAQAGTRSHNLLPLKTPGLFRVIHRVEFKVGEEIGIAGDIGKVLLSSLEPLDSGSGKKKVDGKEKNSGAQADPPPADGPAACTGDDLPPAE